jgi:5-(carboxyamino)imidazole ribonucleotide synthase
MWQKPVQTVGILGAGQLGLMLSDSLLKLGAQVRVLDPSTHSPTSLRTNFVTQAAFDNPAALEHFFSQCDRVTYEFEHIPTRALRTVLTREEHRHKLWPSVEILEIAQNRIAEKSALQQMEIPIAEWEGISQFSQFIECKKRWSERQKKAILKTADGGYDGKGQWPLVCPEDWLRAEESLARMDPFPAFVLEEMCTLVTELSVIVARHPLLGLQVLPAVENKHVNGILDTTLYPPRVGNNLIQEAQSIAKHMAEQLNLNGLMCVEFFVVSTPEGNSVLVNEIAPRPHNSGHVTRCSLTRSQFDVLAQLLLNLPFATEPVSSSAHWGMWNTLGDLWINSKITTGLSWPPDITSEAALCEAMLYGKTEARIGRKMGHVIVKQNSADQVFATIEKFKNHFHKDTGV